MTMPPDLQKLAAKSIRILQRELAKTEEFVARIKRRTPLVMYRRMRTATANTNSK